MQVSYSCVGGFVPKASRCDVDTRDLPPDEAATLEQLVKASDLSNLKPPLAKVHDAPIVTIAVTDGEKSWKVQYPLPLLPASLQPLMGWLGERSVDLLS